MKKFIIKEKSYHLVENSTEIESLRLNEINKYVVALEWGKMPADLNQHFERYEKGFNEQKFSECVIAISDARRLALQIAEGTNYWEYIFALIVLTDEEKNNPSNILQYIQTSHLYDKIQGFYKEGLKVKTVMEAVEGFFLSSRKNYPLDGLRIFQIALYHLAQWNNSYSAKK